MAAPLAAQPSPKIAQATRTTRAPHIDGKLNEAEWTTARAFSDFLQQRPVPGAAPSEATLVYLLYDDEALYVGARLRRADPSAILRNLSRRDGQGVAESFTIIIDPQRDRRTGVGFGVTAAGVRSDYRHTQDDAFRGRESQYDPVWTASAQIDSSGWTAEMRIPLSQLRFPATDQQQWGVQFDRWIPDKNEELQWALIPPSETGYISRFGTLVGLNGVRSVRPVELLPYVAGDATRRATAGPVRNPLNKPLAARVGGDIKAGLGSNLTLDATINPDFGQVEADPAEVNLSAFETFFDERRPFFVEGSEMIRGNGAGYFYARRIGAPPHASASGDFVDMPRASTILGAAKVTGRLPSRLSIGGLAAVTAQEHARTYLIDSSLTSRVRVEPRTAYSVGRLQQDIGKQASTIALSWSTTSRNFAGDRTLTALLPREAYYAGTDWRLRFQQGKYALSGFIAGTHVAGDTAAIRRLQMSSVRFFQRPDLTHVRFDPLRTSMSGYSMQLRADKDAGRRILWGAEVKAESPGFELNDLGRLQSTDDIEYNADLQVRETVPGKYLQSWQLGFETRGSRNYGGVHQGNSWAQNTRVTLKNFWNVNLRSSIDLPTLDDALTRGGPLMGKPREFKQDFRINNAFGAPTFWRLNAGYGIDEFDTWRINAGANITVRPTSRVSLSAEPTYQHGTDPRQYVTRIAGGTRTYGNRYVFGAIHRQTLSAKLRLNYTFSPNLTLEGYAEPFAATGHYNNMGELVAPRSRQLRLYGTDGTVVSVDSVGVRTITDGSQTFTISNRDFHVLSFRSNVVMRWEWSPGSTLFVVWQQNRRTSEAYRQALSPRELFLTTRAAGDNLVSVKLSYWLPVMVGGQR
ncbi:MAG: carbohydrate binding family 9 domain-containing protein [Gemmatimonadaceae bacterium]|nr:carbohydrate binding family 9 domain-containing protein [Gemmatimonadaceae bacterium]